MTKVINFDLAKKLNDAWIKIDAKHLYYKWQLFEDYEFSSYCDNYTDIDHSQVISAPDLEEAIEFIWKRMSHQKFLYKNAWIWTLQTMFDWEFTWTLMEVYEQYLEYLLDNNMLWNQW